VKGGEECGCGWGEGGEKEKEKEEEEDDEDLDFDDRIPMIQSMRKTKGCRGGEGPEGYQHWGGPRHQGALDLYRTFLLFCLQVQHSTARTVKYSCGYAPVHIPCTDGDSWRHLATAGDMNASQLTPPPPLRVGRVTRPACPWAQLSWSRRTPATLCASRSSGTSWGSTPARPRPCTSRLPSKPSPTRRR